MYSIATFVCSPTFVRIDSFPPEWHLIDIILEVPFRNFNDSSTRQQFLEALRRVIEEDYGKTWLTKIESYKLDRDK